MLKKEIRYQKGVGPKIAQMLSKLGINITNDILYYFPKGYEDRRNPDKISTLEFGKDALIRARVVSVASQRTKRNFSIVKAILEDGSGSIAVAWFNQPFLVNVLKKGTEMYVAGKMDRDPYSYELQFTPREYEVIGSTTVTDSIIPKYSLTEGLSQKILRKIMKAVLDTNVGFVKDQMPPQIVDKFDLPPLHEAIYTMHFPEKMEVIERARHRLAFDELLNFELGLVHNKKMVQEQKGIDFIIEGELTKGFIKDLPFKFTKAQNRVLDDILNDMKNDRVMNRLVQGDVGSGKTVVALYAMLVAVQSGYQSAIMAPTEILAKQHHKKISDMVKGLNVEVLLLIGNEKAGRDELYKLLESGTPLIVVGTHALITEKVKFGKLGMVVIDEQHRFGVEQRLKLRQKGPNIDLLVMTATPIPRTLALTLYGDLDRSIIDELPPGRTKIITRFVANNERAKLYEFIRSQILIGRQVFVVCPLVEDSEKLDLKAAEVEAVTLQKVFSEYKVGLVHGRMKAQEKDKEMDGFVKNEINILVSTTVIEVGIDVPNSTIMVIEHAERFGLSQLHQLRGRIGRGDKQSYCFLMGEPKSEASKARIDAMLKTDNGFEIAEADLKLRGPGEFLGLSQSGLPNFRVADIINDEIIIREAREAAELLVSGGYDIKELNIKYWDTNLE